MISQWGEDRYQIQPKIIYQHGQRKGTEITQNHRYFQIWILSRVCFNITLFLISTFQKGGREEMKYFSLCPLCAFPRGTARRGKDGGIWSSGYSKYKTINH